MLDLGFQWRSSKVKLMQHHEPFIMKMFSFSMFRSFLCAAIFELLMLFLLFVFPLTQSFSRVSKQKRIPVCIDLKGSAAKVCGGSFRDFHIKCIFLHELEVYKNNRSISVLNSNTWPPFSMLYSQHWKHLPFWSARSVNKQALYGIWHT